MKSLLRERSPHTATILVAILTALLAALPASAQAINESFDDLQALLANDWFTFNNSSPNNPAVPGFVQCELGSPIPPHMGSARSCVFADKSGAIGSQRTLSTWLVGPTRTFSNGEQISFYTRHVSNFVYRNRMQLRLSTSGSSNDVGSSATDVGVFTTLLLDINPTYTANGNPGAYPDTWTQYTVTISGLPAPTSGRFAFRFFVEDGFNLGSPSDIAIDSLGYPTAYVPTPTPSPTPQMQHVLDFNGDGRTDYSVVRNTGGGTGGQITWFIAHTGTDTFQTVPWGISTDAFVPADYDGDNKTDIAIWRSGPPFGAYFHILRSSDGTYSQVQFGQSGDDPTVTGDYTGDGKADPAVYRSGSTSGAQSFWYFSPSEGPFAGQPIGTAWGMNGDFPAPGDYNGDGKADFVVQRGDDQGIANFLRRNGTGGPDQGGGVSSAIKYGRATDQVAPGDYDGDGMTDLAVLRSQSGQLAWFVLSSSTGNSNRLDWGISASDFPVPGDYDGDGKTDLSVYRPSSSPGQSRFYIRRSGAGPSAYPWGQSGDYPVANYNVH
jgi:hypothetical protein